MLIASLVSRNLNKPICNSNLKNKIKTFKNKIKTFKNPMYFLRQEKYERPSLSNFFP